MPDVADVRAADGRTASDLRDLAANTTGGGPK
jgi:hypothetical protein